MQTKLTLRLDEKLIQHAKSFASDAGKSVSQIVAEYFTILLSKENKPAAPSSAPITQSLRGLLKKPDLDESDYKRHLEEKYR
jgi:hypothetical protein